MRDGTETVCYRRGMSVDVIFVEPCFPANQRQFVRALHSVGARVIGIGERPKSALDDELRHWLFHYEQIDNVTSVASLERAVRLIQERTTVHRLEAVVEAHVMAAAQVRERCGIPGTSVQTSFLCRDKPAMKDALRAAGVPTAASLGSSDVQEISEFADEIGYPLIVKPRDGAGAASPLKSLLKAMKGSTIRLQSTVKSPTSSSVTIIRMCFTRCVLAGYLRKSR